ncbi:unnamed protein product [Bursaphelenchus okinawaensis]|uniref:Uncharacterized protein n=1 Tax=Bursaphelenchus okinawaensis TaxID=465554 RepID=A0A811LQX7_9BILA|nr:unnamed protein product [Bursaphelenchus okinawaensis]CAG9127461.1 unnamed protein product [Bursaphelenchus okinawaensis]
MSSMHNDASFSDSDDSYERVSVGDAVEVEENEVRSSTRLSEYPVADSTPLDVSLESGASVEVLEHREETQTANLDLSTATAIELDDSTATAIELDENEAGIEKDSSTATAVELDDTVAAIETENDAATRAPGVLKVIYNAMLSLAARSDEGFSVDDNIEEEPLMTSTVKETTLNTSSTKEGSDNVNVIDDLDDTKDGVAELPSTDSTKESYDVVNEENFNADLEKNISKTARWLSDSESLSVVSSEPMSVPSSCPNNTNCECEFEGDTKCMVEISEKVATLNEKLDQLAEAVNDCQFNEEEPSEVGHSAAERPVESCNAFVVFFIILLLVGGMILCYKADMSTTKNQLKVAEGQMSELRSEVEFLKNTIQQMKEEHSRMHEEKLKENEKPKKSKWSNFKMPSFKLLSYERSVFEVPLNVVSSLILDYGLPAAGKVAETYNQVSDGVEKVSKYIPYPEFTTVERSQDNQVKKHPSVCFSNFGPEGKKRCLVFKFYSF